MCNRRKHKSEPLYRRGGRLATLLLIQSARIKSPAFSPEVLRFHIFDIEPPSVAEVPLTVYYNIAMAETLKLPYIFAKPAYDPLIGIGNLIFGNI
jgi:hypothetical protein